MKGDMDNVKPIVLKILEQLSINGNYFRKFGHLDDPRIEDSPQFRKYIFPEEHKVLFYDFDGNGSPYKGFLGFNANYELVVLDKILPLNEKLYRVRIVEKKDWAEENFVWEDFFKKGNQTHGIWLVDYWPKEFLCHTCGHTSTADEEDIELHFEVSLDRRTGGWLDENIHRGYFFKCKNGGCNGQSSYLSLDQIYQRDNFVFSREDIKTLLKSRRL